MCGLCIDKTANETRDFCPPERVPINCNEVMPCGRLNSRVSDRASVCLLLAVRRWGRVPPAIRQKTETQELDVP